MSGALTVSIIINVIIVVYFFAAWISLAYLTPPVDEKLTGHGLESLKFFTILSNMGSAIVSIIYLIVVLLGSGTVPGWLLICKLVACAEVTVTFITVIAILIPKYGAKAMYGGGNLAVHLILPLLCIIDCVFFVPVGTLPLPMTLLALIPPAIYGMRYLGKIKRYGTERDGVVYDFYGFMRWGEEKIPVITAIMLSSTLLYTVIIRGLSSLFCVL